MKMIKTVTSVVLLSASVSANAWWGGPFDGMGNGTGNGNMSFSMNASGNGFGNGNGYNNPWGGYNNGYGNGNGNGRLSSRQYKYIMRLADEAGLSKDELDQETLQMFGSAAQFLSKSDASAFIDHLLSK